MSILIDFTLLCIGFYLLTKGADYFIDNSASFAEEKGISPHVAGVTIVAFGTSLPELLVSIISSFQNYNDLALDAFDVPADKHRLEMKTECTIRSAFFTGKRRYAQYNTKKEGVPCNEIDVKGLDFKKSNFYQPSTFSSSEIKSIGFVAFGKDFEAKLDIVKAELF